MQENNPYCMNESEINFFLNCKNGFLISPSDESFEDNKVLLKDKNSSLVFTLHGLYIKYKIKTLDTVFKPHTFFGGEDIHTPKYRPYYIRLSYTDDFKSKIDTILKLTLQNRNSDIKLPNGDGFYAGIGGWGLGSYEGLDIHEKDCIKKLKSWNGLFLFESQSTLSDSIQFTRRNGKIIGNGWDASAEEVCIFDFNVETYQSFLSYYSEEIIIFKKKYLINKDFNLFGFDVERDLMNRQTQLMDTMDKNGDGNIDLNDHTVIVKILQKNQKTIADIDKIYIQKIIKISAYLNTKKDNIQNIFQQIRLTKNKNELEEQVSLLKNQIHTYDSLLFHSLSMITSLIENDLVTFYELYETFDKLGIFNSNWENEISEKLTDISDGLNEIIYLIDKMERNIVQSINNLTYVTQDSFAKLNLSVTNQLKGVDSLLRFGNLLSGIQTYQLYKINKNTKGLN